MLLNGFLIDERPEEVTDMQRSVKGEVLLQHLMNQLQDTLLLQKWLSKKLNV